MKGRPVFVLGLFTLLSLSLLSAVLAAPAYPLLSSPGMLDAGVPQGLLPGQVSARTWQTTTEHVVYMPMVMRAYHPPVNWAFKGVSLVGYWHDAYQLPDAFDQIDYLANVGANAVTVLANWYQATRTATVIQPLVDQTVPDEDLVRIIRYAQNKGLQVILKPHVEASTREWRGLFEPSDHDAWFQSYAAFMTHYAQLAENNNVRLLVIGTEFRSLTAMDADRLRWTSLADALHQVYHGKLTYAAHESDVLGNEPGFEVIPSWFWQHFDYAATTVYYTLSKSQTPSVNELVGAWHSTFDYKDQPATYFETLAAWQRSHGKPVIFAEIGYRNVDCATYAPFRPGGTHCPSPPYPDPPPGDVNAAAQANAYEALFRVWKSVPWLQGVFWWEFEARPTSDRKCAEGFLDDMSFTPCGKMAGEVLRQWYGGTRSTPPPAYTPHLPLIDDFEYLSDQPPAFDRVWMARSSGLVSYTPVTSTHAPLAGSATALAISTTIPFTATPRYEQLAYTFGRPQNLTSYRSLELWVRGDQVNRPPYGGELSVVLVDSDGEPWQSTRWLNRNSGTKKTDGWEQVRIALTNTGVVTDNPWFHPADFVLPPWTEAPDGNRRFDLDQISGIWVKTLTANTTPDMQVWLDDVRVGPETVASFPLPDPPILERFEYQDDASMHIVWKNQSSGAVTTTLDAVVHAPVSGSAQSLRISSYVPCATERFGQTTGFFINGPLDLSHYNALQLWLRGDQLNEPPYGGEFSVVVIDDDNEPWQSTRWLDRVNANGPDSGWITVTIALTNTGQVLDSPWHHPTDFVIPTWEAGQVGNGILDLNGVRGVWIKSLTTQEDCATYPDFTVWVDEVTVTRSDRVGPVALPNPPTLDRFEYRSAELAQVMWHAQSSGAVTLTMDSTTHAPVAGSTRSMRITSLVPAGSNRYEQVVNYFLNGPLDLSGYTSLELWVRGDGVNASPYGGEFSVIVIDGDKEPWQSTRWLDRMTGSVFSEWITVTVNLTNTAVLDNPWNHPSDLVIPSWLSYRVGNGRLDLNQIRGIAITSVRTREEDAPFDIWVDELRVSHRASGALR